MLSRPLALAMFALAAHAQVQFNRDIRPIMAETCFRCHGPDRSSRMAGMRLDIREEALKPTAAGTVPIVPGDPEKSAIVQRVFAAGPRIMPPEFSHKTLTQTQKDTIRRWVAEGAKYEGHWAYQPIRRPAASGTGNPIDALIGDRLTREGLHPSPEADRRTLIRRVTLDLTGLPPTIEEIAAFEKDGDYAKLVDRLMASPRYAEQQAMHWLDNVRYADTCGFHGDNAFPAWPYRDYVLNSFRDNKPFDQFTREQLAGDLIPNATPEQKVASAYNRLNRTSAEGGLQPKEYLAKYAADRVRTTVAVWMGSTVGCAECHDHKFDPFTSRDFYSMKAFFADIKETGLVPDRGAKAWGSQIAMPSPEQSARLRELLDKLRPARSRLEEKMKTLEPNRGEWEKQLVARQGRGELGWTWQRPFSAKSVNGAVLTVHNDDEIDLTSYDGGNLSAVRGPGNGLIVVSGPNPDNETYTLAMKPGEVTWRELGLELVQDEALPGIRLARGADRLVITELDAELDGRKLPFVAGIANLSNQATEYLPIGAFYGDPKTGWAASAYNETPKVMLSLRFEAPLVTREGQTLTVRIHHDSDLRRSTLGRFRLALSGGMYTAPNVDKGKEIPDAVLKALKTPEDKRTTAQKNAIAAHYQWTSPEVHQEAKEVAVLEMALARLEIEIPHAVITEAVTPTETRVLPRGNWMDESGAVVQPAIPAFLG